MFMSLHGVHNVQFSESDVVQFSKRSDRFSSLKKSSPIFDVIKCFTMEADNLVLYLYLIFLI